MIAVAAMVRAINASNAKSRLWIVGAGPMETIYQALRRAHHWKLRHTRLVSHSYHNNEHAMWPRHTMNGKGPSPHDATWGALKTLMHTNGGQIYFGGKQCSSPEYCALPGADIPVTVRHPRQQDGLDTEGSDPMALRRPESTKDWAPWDWLRLSADKRLNFLWDAMRLSTVPDVSDSGMMYYLLTGATSAEF